MQRSKAQRDSAPAAGKRFATTQWTVVAKAGRKGTPESQRALATLCEKYWVPLYAFVRHEGHSAHVAQDLIQGFFARLLDKNYLALADPQRGRFRSFLLAALKHFLANQRQRAKAQKRGGSKATLSLDFLSAETRYNQEPADTITPQQLYERRWALALLEQVLGRLREEFAAAGKLSLFEHLKEYLTGEKEHSYAEIAAELAMSEGAVKVAVHRLRRRYRELLKEEIAQTTAGPEDLDDELRYLAASLGSRK